MPARPLSRLVFLLCIPAAFGRLFFYRPQRILLGFRVFGRGQCPTRGILLHTPLRAPWCDSMAGRDTSPPHGGRDNRPHRPTKQAGRGIGMSATPTARLRTNPRRNPRRVLRNSKRNRRRLLMRGRTATRHRLLRKHGITFFMDMMMTAVTCMAMGGSTASRVPR